MKRAVILAVLIAVWAVDELRTWRRRHDPILGWPS